MHGLVEIHSGSSIIDNIYNKGKISGNSPLILKFLKIYNPTSESWLHHCCIDPGVMLTFSVG